MVLGVVNHGDFEAFDIDVIFGLEASSCGIVHAIAVEACCQHSWVRPANSPDLRLTISELAALGVKSLPRDSAPFGPRYQNNIDHLVVHHDHNCEPSEGRLRGAIEGLWYWN